MSSRKRARRRPRRAARNPGLWKKVALVAVVSVALPAAAVSAWLLLSGSGGPQEPPGPPRAAIVDQLSLTAPNPDFGEQASEMLERAGYQVDYFPGEVVTVDLYRELPTHGYEIILLRAHAAGRDFGDGAYGDDVSLFTSERVSATKYTKEQRERLLKGVGYTARDMEEGNLYFGIPPAFVESRMRGGFDGATVVLMGCDVLRAQRMAEAFIEKGAGTVVGWDAPVSASHTDAATLNLLQHMLDEDLPVQDAAAAAMAELGPDPYYDSVLLSYPSEG